MIFNLTHLKVEPSNCDHHKSELRSCLLTACLPTDSIFQKLAFIRFRLTTYYYWFLLFWAVFLLKGLNTLAFPHAFENKQLPAYCTVLTVQYLGWTDLTLQQLSHTYLFFGGIVDGMQATKFTDFKTGVYCVAVWCIDSYSTTYLNVLSCPNLQNGRATKRQQNDKTPTYGPEMVPGWPLISRIFDARIWGTFFVVAVPHLHPQSDKMTRTCNKPWECTHPFPSTYCLRAASGGSPWMGSLAPCYEGQNESATSLVSFEEGDL